jgi:hypothetical protein
VGARFSAPVQTGPGAHPGSCTMDTESFPGVEIGRGVTLTPNPLLVVRSKGLGGLQKGLNLPTYLVDDAINAGMAIQTEGCRLARSASLRPQLNLWLVGRSVDWKELRAFSTVVLAWHVKPHSFAGRHRYFKETCLRHKDRNVFTSQKLSHRCGRTDAFDPVKVTEYGNPRVHFQRKLIRLGL